VLLTKVGDVRAGGLEYPQAEQSKHGHQREVTWVRRFPGGGEQGLELQVGEPSVGDSAGTAGRRTCSAGKCSKMPSITQVRWNPAVTENRRDTVDGLNRRISCIHRM
jgi:hypothetical protein